MRRAFFSLLAAATGVLTAAATAGAQEPTASSLPPPPLPMAGRAWPVYPMYTGFGPVQFAYGGETFASADYSGYRVHVLPVTYWNTPTWSWRSVEHPQFAEIYARFPNPYGLTPPTLWYGW